MHAPIHCSRQDKTRQSRTLTYDPKAVPVARLAVHPVSNLPVESSSMRHLTSYMSNSQQSIIQVSSDIIQEILLEVDDLLTPDYLGCDKHVFLETETDRGLKHCEGPDFESSVLSCRIDSTSVQVSVAFFPRDWRDI